MDFPAGNGSGSARLEAGGPTREKKPRGFRKLAPRYARGQARAGWPAESSLMMRGPDRWRRRQMAKAYLISFYRSIRNPEALAAYIKLAWPAVQSAGGRFIAR